MTGAVCATQVTEWLPPVAVILSAGCSTLQLQMDWISVATVMTDVFHKNEISLLRKFSKIVRIFDKVDDSKNRGVI
jgi:hypothetical protein